jgi:hypothetical protein
MDMKQTSQNTGERSLAEDLREMIEGASGDRVLMRQFFECFREKGFGILLMMFALPSALPVPAPGYSIPFGIILALLAGQLILGRKIPWLPEWVLRISFKRSFMEKMVPAGIAFLIRTETLVRPRFQWFSGGLLQLLPALLVIVMASFMMIPIPGTNTAPAMVIFLIGLGLSQNDGLVLCLSSLAGIGATLLTILILKYGADIIKGWLGAG